MWEVPEVTCELPPPIPGPGLPARHFKLLVGTALGIDFVSMARSILLLGLLALWAQLQAAPVAGKYGRVGRTFKNIFPYFHRITGALQVLAGARLLPCEGQGSHGGSEVG